MAKLPAFQFYPGDWLRDNVSGCSLAAQGLWLRMMLLMHDSERYGYLSINGLPIPQDHIFRRCGCDSLEQYMTLFAELDNAGVPSRTDTGVIYSRRMVRDERKRHLCSEAGKKGGGNPTFKGVAKGDDKQETKASSSTSASLSTSKLKNKKDPPENGGTSLPKSPYKIDLTGIALPLDEPAKHKLYNRVVAIFQARGWSVTGDLPLTVFRNVAERVCEAKPRDIYPYFDKALFAYCNENAEALAAQTKIERRREPSVKSLGEILAGAT